jgi:hypothetical protein
MPGDKSKTGTADDVRLTVHESYEVQYWSKKFGVTAEELRAAVAAIGPMVADVQRELGK